MTTKTLTTREHLANARATVRSILDAIDENDEASVLAALERLDGTLAAAEHAADTPTPVLIIRDPDCENSYWSDAPIREITVDIGRAFNSYKDLQACVQAGEPEAVDYVMSWWEEVRDLPHTSTVREEMRSFLDGLGVNVEAADLVLKKGGR